MLDVKKLLEKVLTHVTKAIISTQKTASTGSSQYQGYYYTDVAVTTPTGYIPLCIITTSVTDNRFAYVEWLGWTYRVWAVSANTSVTFKVFFVKTAFWGGGTS